MAEGTRKYFVRYRVQLDGGGEITYTSGCGTELSAGERDEVGRQVRSFSTVSFTTPQGTEVVLSEHMYARTTVELVPHGV